jgi:NitT/TauT family transport system substrate-binding protein
MATVSRRCALTLLAATAVAAPRRGAAQSAAPIRIGASASDSYAEPLYLESAGVLQRYGLTVDVTLFASVGPIVQALLAGAIDVGLADMLQVAGMHNRGLPFAFFAGGGLYSSAAPTTALVVPRDSPVRKAADLDGQSVSVSSLASLSEIVTKNWLVRNGGDIASMKIIELPVASTIPTMLRGTVAAAFVGEPFITQFKDQIRWLGRAMDTIGPSFYISSWCASRTWIERNADAAHRLGQALYATARWANAHHPETAAILAKASKIDLDSIRTMNRVTWSTELDTRRMQPVLDAALTYHVIDRPTAAADLIAKV